MKSEFIEKRNHEIVKERESGATYASLARKYNLCAQTIRSIYMDVKEREARADNEFFQLLSLACDNKGIAVRTFKTLQGAGIDSIDDLLKCGAKICEYDGVGPKTMELLQKSLLLWKNAHD